jgi:hypothetical protein
VSFLAENRPEEPWVTVRIGDQPRVSLPVVGDVIYLAVTPGQEFRLMVEGTESMVLMTRASFDEYRAARQP